MHLMPFLRRPDKVVVKTYFHSQTLNVNENTFNANALHDGKPL